MRPPALQMFRKLGMEPDPWQLAILDGNHRRLLLNCSRQAGKSTVVALLSLIEALTVPNALVLLLSRSQRQSTEMFRMVCDFFQRLQGPFLKKKRIHELEFMTRSRVVSLPCAADTIRGFSGVHMLVIDEASRVPDDLYRTVRPMLAASRGRLVCLSTPHGKRGFFYQAWANGGTDWTRIEVPASQISRITPEFLAEERRCLGEWWYRQEYECSFEALEGLVYPDFARCVVQLPPSEHAAQASDFAPTLAGAACWQSMRPHVPNGRPVGGIDFGFRNPFAAVWGILDRDGILWLTGEHYERQKPLSHHVKHLPKEVLWYADPSGATEISELRCAGFTVRRGNNSLRPGIAAVTARLENGTLRVLEGRCPNLLAEAALYRWSNEREERRAETPVDENNHALAAVRYLISKLDERQLGRMERGLPAKEESAKEAVRKERRWLSVRNEALWGRVW